MENYLERDIRFIKGVGESRARLFNKLGIYTVRDMLYYFPRTLEDRSEIKSIAMAADGETVCIKATVSSAVSEIKARPGLVVYTAVLRDESGFINAVWYNNKYISSSIHVGGEYVFYGKIRVKYGKKEIIAPIFEPSYENKITGRIVPVYPLTENLSQKAIGAVMKTCIDYAADSAEETLPAWLREEYRLAEIKFCLKNIHFPSSYESYFIARKRFVFEEFLLLQLGLRMMKKSTSEKEGIVYEDTDITGFISRLPFELTGAQKRTIDEMRSDFSSKRPMGRLIQGDVGSGKTVVAAAGLYLTVKNGYQAAMMVPTEILANQHYREMQKFFSGTGIKVELLTGSTAGKKKVLGSIANGETDIVIGTHALIEKGVKFKNLAFAVTDEQHRFGVRQRGILSDKGEKVHVLVMSATPIPRTLALVLYGDLDISVIDELPPNRQKVDTFVVDSSMRGRVYNFVKKEIEKGRQAYIVCPLVDEGSGSEQKSVVEFTKTLRDILSDIKIEGLHGKMKPKEKDGIMQSFISGETKILVSTTVIEVGVNVPNATIMVVENAERFGLSQLHQLRGRVGRGAYKSYCILFSDSDNEITKKRLDIMRRTNDGFVIAQKDLELRGPGDFFGTRQHGLPELKIANIFTDTNLLKLAQKAADEVLKQDPLLVSECHAPLKKQLGMMFSNKISF